MREQSAVFIESRTPTARLHAPTAARSHDLTPATARLHGLNAMEFLRLLLTDPDTAAAAILPAATSAR